VPTAARMTGRLLNMSSSFSPTSVADAHHS